MTLAVGRLIFAWELNDGRLRTCGFPHSPADFQLNQIMPGHWIKDDSWGWVYQRNSRGRGMQLYPLHCHLKQAAQCLGNLSST
ncbi:hypothetical protein DNTS_027867 [Danionella cerebrum]|uniref:Uncharacterized protein n=1 Tax=Danionella cerebrum TaxID=2873325 RepID=A0A553MQL1_9TELE|nr:hypothetical protein DNTS_027867 [Danionella translucida]